MKAVKKMEDGRRRPRSPALARPMYGEDQRRALFDAAVIAGLRPLQIMSETTAAALAYGIYKQDLPDEKEPSRNVVFVDFGYNALQVTSASLNKGMCNVAFYSILILK